MGARVSWPDQPSVLRGVLAVLAVGAAAVLVPLWAPLVVAAWVAHLSRPILERLTRAFGGRKRAAGLLVLALVLAILLPIGLVAFSLGTRTTELLERISGSPRMSDALRAMVQDANGGARPSLRSPREVVALAREHGERAWVMAQQVAGVAARAAIGLMVFVLGAYVFLIDGERGYRWAKLHAPMRPEHFDRFARAFDETGRGLFVGIVLTGAVQALLATVTYVALKVPAALVLGVLTFFASFLPTVGTSLVWVPVAIGLALSGRVVAAIVLVAVGVTVIAAIDNLLRPVFSHWGRLDLPQFVILVAMFGGFMLVGGWGLLLGPLIVRLFVEALRIAREERLTGAHTTHAPAPLDDDASPRPSRS